MNDIAIVVVKPGLLSMGDIARLRKKGIAVVETDNFDDVRIISEPISQPQKILLNSAMKSIDFYHSQNTAYRFYKDVATTLRNLDDAG